MVWGYLIMSFIILSIGVAVLRNLYKAHVGKTNIKKQIKKRFSRVLGDNAMDNSSLFNPDPVGEYMGVGEESKTPSSDERDPKGGVKDYLGKVIGKFKKTDEYQEMNKEAKEGDKDQYNGQHTRIWGPAGLKDDAQVDSSQSSGPSSGSGIMSTLFGGLSINKKQDAPVYKTDQETVKVVMDELNEIMISNDEPTGYMPLDDKV